jgi:mono/diheme cytochrome c family protein
MPDGAAPCPVDHAHVTRCRGFRWVAALRSFAVRALLLIVIAACGSNARPPDIGSGSGSGSQVLPVVNPWPADWTDDWVNKEGARFANDDAYRRAALEKSLVNHTNTYSQQRLGAYALVERGWDVLPVWNPRSAPVNAELAAQLERGEMPSVEARAPLWDGKVPTTTAEWAALGKRVFFEYPMRAEVFMEWGLTKRALADQVGVERTADGSAPGLVVFANVDGRTRVGITCAICHTSVRDGELVVGAARRRFDYGKLRLEFFADTRGFVEPELARRMGTWGPGRADVTEDNDEDPVAIPDLWGLQHEQVLTQAGTIDHSSPLALAIRQDTQLTHSNHQRVRPPRELAWALAIYLYSLRPPARTTQASFAQLVRGAGVFSSQCTSCHDNVAYAGRPIEHKRVGTDPALATGQARGTGRYRIAPLIDVANAAPYLHHGAVRDLDELLSSKRLAADFDGRLGKGAIPGHTFGTDLAADDRAALISFLGIL